MKIPTLITTLRKLFTWLYNLQMLVIVLVPPLLMLALWAIPNWQLSKYDLPKDGSRIIYDTTSMTGNDKKWWAANSSQYNHEIDSILKADPTTYILRAGSSYRHIGRNFWTSVTLQLHGEAHPSFRNPGPVYRVLNKSKSLEYPLSDHHPVMLMDRPSGFDNHHIVFSIYTLNDYLALPFPVMIWQISRLLFNVILLFITRQFVLIFTDLENDEVFSGTQIRRITQIGYYFIAYALSTVVIDVSEVVIAQWYVRQHHLEASFSGPITIGNIPETGMLLVVGLLLLVLARVFHYGLQLKQEQDLTI